MQTNCEKYEIYITGLIDGELDEAAKKELFLHLAECDVCREKFSEQQKIKGATMKLKENLSLNMDSERYWSGLFNRMERSLGWFFTLLGATILFLFGIYEMFSEFWNNPEIPFMIKTGTILLSSGLFWLLLSVLREKLYIAKNDKYKEIKL